MPRTPTSETSPGLPPRGAWGASKPAIIGLSGLTLTAEEVALLRAERPFGIVLFRRNVDTPAQLRALTASLRDLLGEATPILVDQEGGRVARLRPPHWPVFPAPAQFEGGPAEAARANAEALARCCLAEGLNVICAPCLDLRLPGAHDVIGDRAFSADPNEVIRLGAAWIEGMRAGGATPVLKHIPGHGRAMVDSHFDLPVVTASRAELEQDFAPFRALAAPDLWGMTAHILYPALDEALCATLSPRIIAEVIRGEMGFTGTLISDDLAMKALQGSPGALAAQALAAGCDAVSHCSGVLEDSAAVLAACPAPALA
jgi:beta-N-acetylhexosaminidase